TTRNGHINISTTVQKIRERCSKAIGGDHLAADPDYATAKARSANRDRLGEEIDRLLAGEDSAAWIARLNEAGVPCGPIYAIDEMFSDPQVEHLGVTATVTSPQLGPLTMLAQPVRLSRTPSKVDRHPPAVGEHTDEVLRE